MSYRSLLILYEILFLLFLQTHKKGGNWQKRKNQIQQATSLSY